MRAMLTGLLLLGVVVGAGGCVKRTTSRNLHISELSSPLNQSTDEQGRRVTRKTLWFWDKDFWK